MRKKLLFALFIALISSINAQTDIDCDTVLEIWQIQGSTDTPNCEGDRIDTHENIVTTVGNAGFFMQTPPERSDGDITTSDGIYAFTNFPPDAWGIQVGDIVNVNGRVQEEFALTQIVVTGQRRVEIISSGNTLPDPVDLATVDLSYTPGGVHPLERYEGMLVMVEDAFVTATTNRFDEFGISLTGGRPRREMGIEPDNTPQFMGMGLPEFDLNTELIEVDPPEMGLPTAHIYVGSRATVTGGLAYAYTDYQIWPTLVAVEEAEFAVDPVRAREEGEFTIATQNVENFFDITDDPDRDDSTFEDYVPRDAETYQIRLNKLSEQIRTVLDAPDIVAIQEIENNRALADLMYQINADDPTLRYAGCLEEGHDGRGIDNAFIVRLDTVNLNTCYQMPGSYEALQPNSNAFLFGRPPLVLEADYLGGEEPLPMVLINLHIKSLSGIETDNTQERRLAQATMVAEYVQSLMDEDPDRHIVVLGDLNGFEFSDGLVDVVNIIAGTHNPDEARLAPENDLLEPDLVNQVFRVQEEDRYSYIFNSTIQVLDHILTTQSLDALVTDAQFSRGNADALTTLHETDGTALRSSDHDGFVIYVKPE